MNDNSFTLGTGAGGPATVSIDNQHCTGEIHLHGATVTAWQPKGEQPVLWLSGSSAFDGDSPIRGGVPICLPWFGPGRDGDRQPAHGWARLSEWEFVGADDVEAGTCATFVLQRDGLELRYQVTMGERLEIALDVTNIGQEAVEIEEALHTYLAVGDISRVSLSGLEGVDYVDKTAGGTVVTQDGDITFDGETDRVYLTSANVTVSDPAGGRKLLVQSQGARNTVVWNPGPAKAAAMPDFGDDEWTQMVCVEAANALDNFYRLQPGGTHSIAQKVSVV